jgi:hypothetical protein
MKPRPRTIYWALSVCVSLVTVAGCGTLQPPIGASPGSSRIVGAATHVQRASSWMLPEAKGENLIYVSDIAEDKVFVLSFPGGNLVGRSTSPISPGGCVATAWGMSLLRTFPITAATV